MTDITVSSGKGFRYVKSEIVHETDYQKIELQVVEVPGKDGKPHHYDLEIKKLSKNPLQSWAESEVSKIRFTSDKPGSLQKLVEFIKLQPDLAKYRNAELTVTNAKGLSKDEREFMQKVLTAFNTPEKRKLLVQAKKEDVTNLYAAVKHAKNKKAADELNTLLNNEAKESKLQAWIKENTWVFGVEYIQVLDLRKIGIHSESDFIVESLDNYADLIELKKCDFKLFLYDESHDSYYPSSELSKVLGQSIKYLRAMEDHRLILKDEDGLDVLKPRIKIVIGRSSTMDDKEKEALRLQNDSLHNIEIMTYDEIKLRANKLNEFYSNQDL